MLKLKACTTIILLILLYDHETFSFIPKKDHWLYITKRCP